VPTQDEVLGYFETLSNWGRWGDDDQLGTLNHITPDVRKQAAASVRHGVSVSCACEVPARPGGFDRSTFAFPIGAEMPGADAGPPGMRSDQRWGSSGESLSFGFHGGAHTHVDSLAHIFWEGKMYNGRPADLVDAEEGARWGAITAAADGMVTRGVLLDIPPTRGADWLEPGEPVFPADLEAAEARQDVRVRPGDAVLLRTGFGRLRHRTGQEFGDAHMTQAGWHAACMPWLHEREVAVIGCDTAQDAQPSGYDEIFMPVHTVGIVAMGLWLLDNCDLEACAATAERLQQWTFHLSLGPIRFAGTSGSPVNPIATF
jgi:kynurenine formamidase